MTAFDRWQASFPTQPQSPSARRRHLGANSPLDQKRGDRRLVDGNGERHQPLPLALPMPALPFTSKPGDSFCHPRRWMGRAIGQRGGSGAFLRPGLHLVPSAVDRAVSGGKAAFLMTPASRSVGSSPAKATSFARRFATGDCRTTGFAKAARPAASKSPSPRSVVFVPGRCAGTRRLSVHGTARPLTRKRHRRRPAHRR